jgi:hypothetical protein
MPIGLVGRASDAPSLLVRLPELSKVQQFRGYLIYEITDIPGRRPRDHRLFIPCLFLSQQVASKAPLSFSTPHNSLDVGITALFIC